MYKIIFYEDINGKSEVFDYIKSLHECSDKNSKVNFAKIIAYLRVLSDRGTHFIKKTRKTPVGEIEKAKRNLKDYREREG